MFRNNELRYALRQLKSSPGFSLIAVLTLALGIAATASIFSVVEAVLLRPMPFAQPEQLVILHENVNKLGSGMALPAPDVITFQHESHAFASLGGYTDEHLELSTPGAGDPERLNAMRMTASVFSTLGVSAQLGRIFTTKEDEQGQPLAVLSYSLWRSRFHGDPAVIGQKVTLDRNPYTVIGVMPRSFEFPLTPGKLGLTQLWVPMSFTDKEKADSGDNWDYSTVARLKPGVTIPQAAADSDRILRGIQAQYPPDMGIQISASVVPLKEETVAKTRPLLRLLFFSVIVVLLIACANTAGLLLVRGLRRRHEIALRSALGARSAVLVRQSLAEGLLISIAGGVLGLLFASAGLTFWTHLLPSTLPRIESIELNGTVIAFAATAALLTGILCGIAPAMMALRTEPSDALKEGGRSGSSGTRETRLRAVFVVLEIATAFVLLTAAGLLLRSFEKMRNVDPGFQPEHTLAAIVSLPSQQYRTQDKVDQFNRELLRRLESLPSVQSASLSSALPMAEPSSERFFTVEGRTATSGSGYDMESQTFIVGNYFRTMQIPLLHGRYLTDADNATAPLVVVISRTLAHRYWPNQDPLGKRIKWGITPGNEKLPWITIVGEVADTKQGGLDSDNLPQVYQPLEQLLPSFGAGNEGLPGVRREMRIAVRTSAAPEIIANDLRRAVWSLDPQLAVAHVQTMQEAISATEAPRRFNTFVIAAFALAAVLLSTLGIYGIIAFSVAQRVREIAVRMAVGADRHDVLSLVLKNGLRLAIVGCALGIAGAFAVTRLLRSLLFEVSPFDLSTFALAACAVMLLAILATWIPARRAASIEPMEALRSE